MALFRIIEAAEGNIKIDSVDISQIGLNLLRSSISVIPQDPFIFSGTIRENVDPFGMLYEENIWLALEKANLKTYVESLDKGLDYPILQGGENLSVGQRQLLCLARALVKKTKILVLDEVSRYIRGPLLICRQQLLLMWKRMLLFKSP